MSDAGDFLRDIAKQWRAAQENDKPALHVHRQNFSLEHWQVVSDPGYFPNPEHICVWEVEQTFASWNNPPKDRKGLHMLLWLPPIQPGELGRIAFQPDVNEAEVTRHGPISSTRGVAPLFREATEELSRLQAWLEDLMWSEWLRRGGKTGN